VYLPLPVDGEEVDEELFKEDDNSTLANPETS
jgi:hypothetical protein